MKSYFERHRRVVGLAGALIGFAVAIIYLFVVPEEVDTAKGIQKIILTYGHSVCWVLLGVASALWAMNKAKNVMLFLAYAALAMYMLFIAVLVASAA